MLNRKRALTAAILLSCSCLMAPYYAHAEEEDDAPDCGHGQHYMNINIDSATPSSYTYTFDIYTASTHPGPHWRGEYQMDDDDEYILDANGEKIKVYTSYRDFFAGEERTFNKSIAYIHNMIQPSPTETIPVIKLELLPDQDANAAAESDTYITFNDAGKPVQISDTKLAAVLQGKYQPEDTDAEPVANVEVNLAPPSSSWYIDKFPVLPSNGTNSDYYGTITHEMFHALGLGTYISENTKTFGTSGNYHDNGDYRSMAVFNKYEMGIRDAFGRVAYYEVKNDGTPVYYDGTRYNAAEPINPNADNITINGELISRTIVPITLEQFNNPSFQKKPDEFYVLRGDDVGTNSGTYFTGTNVKEVLTTNGLLARIAWPDGSDAPAVQGLPLNGYEDSHGIIPELSHIELQNVNMSHQAYRNWCAFTEAELALMQDLGYNIDRSKYFGKSIYNSGTESTPFTYTNDNVFNSDQMHGIGLHVYGSYVDVTQKADASINASGDYGIGIRVDGVGNKVTIDSNISANGEGGNGLLVAYGKKHNITLNAGKTIEATGTDGVAARFDFGSNELGDLFEYRGSYILTRYTSKEDIDEMIEADPDNSAIIIENHKIGWSPITADKLVDAINGELVTNFNVAGTLKGEKAAIYISENALVQNINIMNGASIQGDIISKWNPNGLIYDNPAEPENNGQNQPVAQMTLSSTGSELIPPGEDSAQGSGGSTNTDINYQYEYTHLEPETNATIDLGFGVKVENGTRTGGDSDFKMTYNDDIKGVNGLNMHIMGGNLEYNGTAEVLDVYINPNTTLSGKGTYVLSTKYNIDARGTLNNEGTFDLGNGITTINIKGNYRQYSTGNLLVDFNTDNKSDKLNITEGSANLDGKITLTPQVDYYYNGQKITIDVVDAPSITNNIKNDSSLQKVIFNNISPVLNFSLNEEKSTEIDQGKYVINVERVEQGYQSVATGDISSGIGSAIDIDSQKKKDDEQYVLTIDKEKLLTSLDYPLTITNTDAERKKVVSNNLKKLNPNVVGSQAQAVIETHTTLNNLVSTVSSLNVGSMSMNTPVSRRIGGLGPNRVEPPKYNSWRNIVIPFTSYTDQHNGTNGYTNHNSGVIGAMERTFANGLTHGYHAALNHQSTEDSGSTIKGEGIYLGTHASYAPVEWNGWSVFGSARFGVEQMRSHRRVYISDSYAPYYGTADGDWTGYSGNFNIGTALTKEHGVVKSGPFAALDYSFAHRPSVHEDGGAVRTNLESATYDSLRTQLGYRLVTNPKPLDSYDSTQWQAHASVAWNHELLSDNGRTNYQLAEFPGTPIEDTIETYGRDSMSIAAGVIFKTPNRLDVGLTLGSDIYRKGGSSIYGKVNFEWKF